MLAQDATERRCDLEPRHELVDMAPKCWLYRRGRGAQASREQGDSNCEPVQRALMLGPGQEVQFAVTVDVVIVVVPATTSAPTSASDGRTAGEIVQQLVERVVGRCGDL